VKGKVAEGKTVVKEGVTWGGSSGGEALKDGEVVVEGESDRGGGSGLGGGSGREKGNGSMRNPTILISTPHMK